MRNAFSAALGCLAAILATTAPATAQSVTVTQEWVSVESTASRYVTPLQAQTAQVAIAAFGPFRVLDEHTAALVGITDGASPDWFDALLGR